MKGVGRALVMLVVAACQQQPSATWTRPGASAAEFDADRSQCLQTSRQQLSAMHVKTFGGDGTDGQIANGQIANGPLFATCMNARGWSAGK